jgi:hypothetical protein
VPHDPSELLRQADALARSAGATQADLRRAISTAYYVVFHFCLSAAADMVCGIASRSTARYSLVYRSVDHKTLSGPCGQLSQTKSQNVAIMPAGGLGSVADFARVTANLRRQRNLADYDPSQSFFRRQGEGHNFEARQAIAWFSSSADEQKEAFLTRLLFRQRS